MKKQARNIGLSVAALAVAAGGAVGVGATMSNAADTATGTVNTAGSALSVRSGPGTAFQKVGSLKKGTKVKISCQQKGSTVTGRYGTSSWWNKIGKDRWVSDAYIYTGSDGRVADLCKKTGNNPPPPPSNNDGTKRKWGITTKAITAPWGQCTWGAYQKFKAYAGKYPLIQGNAKDMANNAARNGWTTSFNPHANAMVVFQPGVHGANRTYGHVAWVTSVRGKTINIVEMNWKGEGVWSKRTVTDVKGMRYILAPKAR